MPSALTIMNNLITLHVFKERTDAQDLRGQIVVQSLVMGVRNTFEYSYMKYLYNEPNFTSKNGLKMLKNRFYRHVEWKNFLGGPSPNPPYERGYDPFSCSPPARAFGTRGTPMAFNSRTTFQKPTTALLCKQQTVSTSIR